MSNTELIAWLRAFEGPGGRGTLEAAEALEAVTAERDNLARLHEVATENAARYSAAIARAVEYVDDPGNWSALDGRRAHILGLLGNDWEIERVEGLSG